MHWTQADDDLVKVLWASGYSAGKIAHKLGDRFSRNAVIGKVHRLRLTRRDQSELPRAPRASSPRRTARPRFGPVFEHIEAVTDDLKPLMARKKQPPDKTAKPKKRKHTFIPLPPSAATVITKRAINNGAGLSMRDIKWVAPEKAASALDPDEIPIAQRKTFFDLQEADCRFPYGDVGDPSFFYCGAESVHGFRYCGMHCRIAYAGNARVNTDVYAFRKET